MKTLVWVGSGVGPTFNSSALAKAYNFSSGVAQVADGDALELIRLVGRDLKDVSSVGNNVSGLYGLRTEIPGLRPLALTSAAPTITYSATAPVTGRRVRSVSDNVNIIGCGLVWNDAEGNATCSPKNGMYGAEFILNGQSVTFGWKSDVSVKERFSFFIDGLPVSLTPETPSVSTTAGALYYCTLTFGASGIRKITILGTAIHSFQGLTIPVTASITKTKNKRRVFVTGDSFLAGSAAVPNYADLPGPLLSRKYDCSIATYGYGGSGYTVTGGGNVFGSSVRATYISRVDPHDIVIYGSVNDDANYATVQAAVEACIATYRAVAPSANIIVFGPPPAGHTSTLSANRTANNKAVKAGCVATGVTFVDLIGTATYDAIPAFVIGGTYSTNAVVSYLGSVWIYRGVTDVTCSTTSSYPGGLSNRWDLVTAHLYGTGHTVTPAADGSRDVLLYGADSVHPTALQCANIAHMIGEQLFSRG